MPFILLTTFLMPFCILASWNTIETRVKAYYVAFLVLETTMIGVFAAGDLVLFYLFFEAGLIPMFLIIGIWGGKRRIYASFKFFLYTLLGSVLMLLAIMAMYWQAGTTDIQTLLQHRFPASMQTWLWLAFFASFAVKMPMWPVHTWLPDAHVEAPTAGSVILAGILLKMGGYGFIRFSLPMFPDASLYFAAAGLRALGRRDHLHLARRPDAGGHEEADRLFVGRPYGLRDDGPVRPERAGHPGRACSRWSRHGLVSGALFLCVGVVYDRMHTREIAAYGGLVKRMPLYAVALMVFTMANVGLPGTSGFVGEFLTMMGAFRSNPMGRRSSRPSASSSRPPTRSGSMPRVDLRQAREAVAPGHPRPRSAREADPRAARRCSTIYYGVHPAPILDTFAPPTEALMQSVEDRARDHARPRRPCRRSA